MSTMLERLMAHRSEFLRYLRKQGATEAQADDLLQSAVLRGLEPWASLPAEDKLVLWFYRVLHNALIDHARRVSTANKALGRYAQEASDPEPTTGARRVCRCTRRALASMKRTTRASSSASMSTALRSKTPRGWHHAEQRVGAPAPRTASVARTARSALRGVRHWRRRLHRLLLPCGGLRVRR